MIFIIVTNANLNPFFFETSGKNSFAPQVLPFSDYMTNWHVNNNNSVQDAETGISNFQQEQMSFVESNNVPADKGRDGPMDSAWPIQSHDMRHTGLSQYSTKENPGTEKWRFKTLQDAGTIESGAIIDNNGNIYFGSMGTDHKLYALYPNGTEKWHFKTSGAGLVWCTPALAEDGTIYFGTWGSSLFHALHPNGTLKWIYATGPSSSPSIAEDGTIYVGSDNSYIWALNPNGTMKWQYDTGGIVMGCPAIGPDGTVYIGSEDHYLYALYPNGTLRWRYNTGSYIKGSASIAEDETIYIPSFNGYFYVLSPNGTLKWKGYTGDSVAAAGVAFALDGTIYVGTEHLRAYYPNGTLKWDTDIPGDIYGTVPAVSADGTIYISAGVSLIAVNPDGTIKWKKQICNMWAKSSPCIDENGSIYVGSSWTNHDGTLTWGYLHAFGDAPLSVDAGGPYSGNALESISFMSTTFGGTLPYTFNWEFGDGSISDQEHPSHTYARPGEYVAMLTLIDGEGNSSSDTANVSVGTSLPTVRILRPENALYLFNIRLISLKLPVIIGRITLEAEAFQEDVGIEHVEFYIDHEYRFSDYDAPYQWAWLDRSLSFHRIAVYAISNDGKVNGIGIDNIFKIF